MKIKHQLSVATLVMAGVFATGCSQQSVMGEGASQVAGGQQVAGGAQVAGGQQVSGGEQVAGGQQVAGGEQVAGGQQVSGGEQVAGGQQVAGDTQVAGGQQMAGDQQTIDSQIPEKMVPKTPVSPAKPIAPAKPMVKPKQVMKPKPMAPRPASNCHGHAANSMTKTVRHCHKNPRGQHNYKAKQAARPAAKPRVITKTVYKPVTKTVYKTVPKVVYKDRVVYKPVYKTAPAKAAPRKPVNRWCHSHPANSLTKSVSHCHKYNQRNHSHMYGGKRPAAKPAYRAPAKPAYVAPAAPKAATPPPVDVFALQQKLKAKGYYKGPIDGVVGSGTRAALQQFMQNR